MNGHEVTDWKAIALFLANLVARESPEFTPMIFQLIADNSKPTEPAAPAERHH
jgi:hypothetical protein